MAMTKVWALIIAVLMLLVSAASEGRAAVIKHVIVIAFENTDARRIYGNHLQAPYINKKLLPIAARAGRFVDILGLSVRSQPHYILMQAAKRSFSDHTFTTNADPSALNSTASHAHLIWQLNKSAWPVKPSWMAYQQGLNFATGACPITSAYPYGAKHNPFVYFKDISGDPPDANNAYCAAHHQPLSALATDLTTGNIANYVFITPDMCHDMHDKCHAVSRIRAGDRWLESWMPRLMTWANANEGVIFLMWDEGKNTRRLPFLAIGPGVKKGFASNVVIDHRSFVRSMSEIFEMPMLLAVGNVRSLESLFEAGAYP